MTRRMAWLGAGLLLVLAIGCAGDPPPGAPEHHIAGGFQNPPGSPERNPWYTRVGWLAKRFFQGPRAGWTGVPDGHVLDKAAVEAGLAQHANRDSVTWIGHMTALLRLDGKVVLTDPLFSDFATPVPPLGPRRVVPPALTMDELPPIDVVLVSHSHFDHLDLPTIDNLPNRARITAIVPLKLGHFFERAGYGRVVELDWHDSAVAHGITFTAMPVVHWSKRSIWRTNDTLWAGWAIESAAGRRIYFGGDAEYGRVYKANGARYADFDLAMLSLGAFRPRIVMNGAHCVPETCLQLGLDLQAHALMAMHWGTLPLGDDEFREPVERFLAEGRRLGIASDRLWVFKIGETRPLTWHPDRPRPAVAGRAEPAG